MVKTAVRNVRLRARDQHEQNVREAIQSATDMLKHVAAYGASRAFATVERDLRPETESFLPDE